MPSTPEGGTHTRRSRGTGTAARTYADQREAMVARAWQVFPDSDRIEAFAAPAEPYVILWRGKRGFFCPYWEIAA